MKIGIRMRFSLAWLFCFTAITALCICWLQTPERTASKLARAIQMEDRDTIKHICSAECAEKILSELPRDLTAETYAPEYLANNNPDPIFQPALQWRTEARDWRKIWQRRHSLHAGRGLTDFTVEIEGNRAVRFIKREKVISFTYPILR